MGNEQYQQNMAIADAYVQKEDYKEAERVYKSMLNIAAPEDMQRIIDLIRHMRNKIITAPKEDAKKQKQETAGFRIYDITFDDVIGYNAAKRVMRRILERPMKYKEGYTQLRMSKSTGILLYGPPGTGKTFIAKGISGEFKLPMKDIVISEILDKYVGGSEKGIKKAFDDAKLAQPSILFFDEFDALGASRENANDFTSADLKNMVNELLKQLSELHDNKETMVFVVAATNLPWLLDPAIKRSGRIEHHVFLGPPGFWDRIELFKYYLNLFGTDYTLKANLMVVALATIRYSPADIEKVCSSVKSDLLDSNRKIITTHDIQKVLKDKTKGESSLDAWVLKAKDTYIKKSKVVVHHTGFLGLRKQKERIDESGKISDGEMKTYKPLINYIKRTMRWWSLSNVIRFLARGF